jgi:D-sedoheptulose 7-phosphate isomerase
VLPTSLKRRASSWKWLAMSDDLHDYVETYLEEAVEIARPLSRPAISQIVAGLGALRNAGGRLFILGVGGSAANASHAVNDFRKIADIESYTPTDNVAELTARINDDGWDSSYHAWLRASRLNAKDALLVLSVGGGNEEKRVSVNLIEAIRLARKVGAKVFGIVGRDGGYTAQASDACVIIPSLNSATVTPHAEAFQAVVWHLIVSHPALRANEMKWESVR